MPQFCFRMDVSEPHSDSNDSYSSQNSYYTQYSPSDSLTSSIFGFVCKICFVRCVTQSDLHMQYLQDDVFLIDTDKDIWLKCDECGSTYHKSCWDNIGAAPNQEPSPRFVCCKYLTLHVVFVWHCPTSVVVPH